MEFLCAPRDAGGAAAAAQGARCREREPQQQMAPIMCDRDVQQEVAGQAGGEAGWSGAGQAAGLSGVIPPKVWGMVEILRRRQPPESITPQISFVWSLRRPRVASCKKLPIVSEFQTQSDSVDSGPATQDVEFVFAPTRSAVRSSSDGRSQGRAQGLAGQPRRAGRHQGADSGGSLQRDRVGDGAHALSESRSVSPGPVLLALPRRRADPPARHAPQDERKPDPPREVFLINELIRDYLEFQGYKHTLSVFQPGLSCKSRPRQATTASDDSRSPS